MAATEGKSDRISRFFTVLLLVVVVLGLSGFVYLLLFGTAHLPEPGQDELPLPPLGPVLALDPEDRAWLDSLGPIRMGVDPAWEPYEQLDSEGRHTGIAADLLRLVAGRLGLDLQVVVTRDWDETMELAMAGKLHMVGFLNQSAKREVFLGFTAAYFTDPTVLVTHVDQGYIADLAGLEGAVVALPSGTSIEERLRRDYPSLKMVLTSDEAQAFQMVSERQADLTVRSLTMAAWTIRRAGLSNLKVSGQIQGYDNLFRVGVRKDLTRLRDLLDKGIATLSPQEVRQVVDRHIAIQVTPPVDYLLLGRIFLVVVAAAAAAMAWIVQLRAMNRRMVERDRALAQSEQRYRQLVDNSNDGIVVAQGDRLRFVNPAMSAITGYSSEALLGFSVQELVNPQDRDTVSDMHGRRLSGEKDLPLYAFRLRKADGRWIWVEVGGTVIEWNGEPATLNFISDISRRKEDEARINSLLKQLEAERDQARESALTDGLTGLPNRRHFDLALEEEVLRHRRSGSSLSLIMVDIDHFKRFNDHYGHQGGDDCLRSVGAVLAEVAGRAPDMAARYGGEEFVILLPDTPGTGAAVLGERLRAAVEALGIPHAGSDTGPVLTISLGGAVWSGSNDGDSADLIRRADEALYKAKEDGRNRYVGSDASPALQGSRILADRLQAGMIWNKEWDCGHPQIDGEHHHLFARVNELLAAETSNPGSTEVRAILDQLLDEVGSHFAHEESLLAEKGYGDLEAHRALHEGLQARALDLVALCDEGRIGLMEMIQFLANEVIAGHMLTEDRKFHGLLGGASP